VTETVFIVNPAAANGSTGRRWPEIAHQAAAAGLEGDALISERRGHLGELARSAALGGARLLVVVGGDGSINEVANGLAGRWSDRGILAVEMEAAVLFTLGALRKIRAGCMLIVSDVIVEGAFLRISDEDMRKAVDEMTELALHTVTA
jgi:nucleoside phosphorylase